MTRLSTLARAAAELTTALILAALVAITAACSGGSGAAPASPAAPSGNPPQGETIEGVATPSSVAVVTATNAQ
jgi:hypothetical protein